MSSLNPRCRYRNSLGEPGKGIHSYRFAGLAIVDVVFTILAALILSRWTGSFGWTAVALFAAGIILHRLFCVETTVDRLIFGK